MNTSFRASHGGAAGAASAPTSQRGVVTANGPRKLVRSSCERGSTVSRSSSAFGGSALAAAGATVRFGLSEHAVMGVVGVLKQLPLILRAYADFVRLLRDDPSLVARVNTEYTEAGADVAITATYQASFSGFAKAGISEAEAVELMETGVAVAAKARDEWWEGIGGDANGRGRRRPLVAASVGPYGASLANGSECHQGIRGARHHRTGLRRRAVRLDDCPRRGSTAAPRRTTIGPCRSTF